MGEVERGFAHIESAIPAGDVRDCFRLDLTLRPLGVFVNVEVE